MFPKPVIAVRSRLKPIGARIELTALVDVLFLLLIFFMVSSSFIRVSGTKVELPETENPFMWGASKYVITILADGSLYLNDHLVDMEGLKSNLLSLGHQHLASVVVRADTHAFHGDVAKVLALISRYGITPVIATSSIQPKTPVREPPREP